MKDTELQPKDNKLEINKTFISEDGVTEKSETPIIEGRMEEKNETPITKDDMPDKTEMPVDKDKTPENRETFITEGIIQQQNETPITGSDVQEKSEKSIIDAQNNVPPSPEGPVIHISKLRVRRTPKILDLKALDIRVGRVDDVDSVEDEEGVFVLTIDVRRPERKIASSSLLSTTGFDVYDLIDTKVVTVLNGPVTLTPDDTECNVRVLAAVRMGGEDGTVVEEMEVLKPPKKAKTGSRIFAEGYIQEQYWALKEKVYRSILKDLMVDSEHRAVYRGNLLQVKGRSGFVTTETLKNCSVFHI